MNQCANPRCLSMDGNKCGDLDKKGVEAIATRVGNKWVDLLGQLTDDKKQILDFKRQAGRMLDVNLIKKKKRPAKRTNKEELQDRQ